MNKKQKLGTKECPNFNISLPGHRNLCGCNDCYWYRRGIVTPTAKKILD